MWWLWVLAGLAGEPAPHTLSLPMRTAYLPNGLKVVVQHDPTLTSVGATMVIDGGSAFDPWEREGLAHVVEHLWFRSDASMLGFEAGRLMAPLKGIDDAILDSEPRSLAAGVATTSVDGALWSAWRKAVSALRDGDALFAV